MKEQKGITLVALVITIIVLLILAGVSIAALGGQNGILTNASKSKQENAIGEAKDIVAMAINESINAYYSVTYNGATDAKVVQGKMGDTAINYINDQKSRANGVDITVSASTVPADGTVTITIKTTDKNPKTVSATLDEDAVLGSWR